MEFGGEESKVFFVSSFLMVSTLRGVADRYFKSAQKGRLISSFDKILIPDHVHGKRWVLYIADSHHRIVWMYNPIRVSQISTNAMARMEILKEYIQNEAKLEMKDSESNIQPRHADAESWPSRLVLNFPHQKGCDDCGVFCMWVGHCIERGFFPRFSQKDICFIREKSRAFSEGLT